MFSTPTIEDFKAFFNRDFPYGTDINANVVDTDIARAFVQANASINQEVWGTQDIFTLAYMFLAAHELVRNLQSSSLGVNGQFSWIRAGKGVGGVSESLAVPPDILANPAYAAMADTYYGAKYLAMLIPRSVGSMFSVRGMSHP